MIDFTPLRNKERTMRELVAGLKPDDLRRLTNEMIDTELSLIAECTDADVTFEPSDPGAHDPVAALQPMFSTVAERRCHQRRPCARRTRQPLITLIVSSIKNETQSIMKPSAAAPT